MNFFLIPCLHYFDQLTFPDPTKWENFHGLHYESVLKQFFPPVMKLETRNSNEDSSMS